MSIACMQRVWDHSEQKGSALLLLLAIADYASEDGTNAYPSIATLAKKTRMSERQVKRLIQQIAETGELDVISGGAGPKDPNRYTVNTGRSKGDKMTPSKGDKLSLRVTSCPNKGDNLSPDPITDPLVVVVVNEEPAEVSPLPDEKNNERTNDAGFESDDLPARTDRTLAVDCYERTFGMGTLALHDIQWINQLDERAGSAEIVTDLFQRATLSLEKGTRINNRRNWLNSVLDSILKETTNGKANERNGNDGRRNQGTRPQAPAKRNTQGGTDYNAVTGWPTGKSGP